jgi:hypothetical protein
MTNDKIHVVININGYTLIVFYTNAQCWQFRVIGTDGSVYGSTEIFYYKEVVAYHQRSTNFAIKKLKNR